jgi:hypothetical protein
MIARLAAGHARRRAADENEIPTPLPVQPASCPNLLWVQREPAPWPQLFRPRLDVRVKNAGGPGTRAVLAAAPPSGVLAVTHATAAS